MSKKKIVETFRANISHTLIYKIYESVCKDVPSKFNMWPMSFKPEEVTDSFSNEQIGFYAIKLSIPNTSYHYIQVVAHSDVSEYFSQVEKCIEFCHNLLIKHGMERIEL